uniref:Uncharacterized protein n=1 Tax=Amphora coffeiformis TaxID=265554 RepID=A0A6S8MF83_9STRA|mmetsp:Transcript_8120/g.15495  ORF Transcript_8120/g.15495 Transcript_8120/m.15495 type:complete len:329 (+) Transcript_8120:127-1113(+)
MASQMDFDVSQFERDASTNLGNANGNIFVSKPGIPKQHDGQVFVRLKKKRFVVLDYTIQPNETDMATASGVAHMEIPSGAGKTQCITKDCHKVGVPVKLYDSNPEDSVSLYLRSGLCFECQRNLNEKRRVDRRKRPHEGAQLLYSIASPSQKKFKINGGDVFELKDDAIIVNGSIKGVKLADEGHSPQDIAVDLQDMLRESTFETERLLTAAGNPGPDPMVDNIHGLYEKAFTAMNKAIFLMTQWKAAYDNAATANDPNSNNHMVSLLLAADKDQQRVPSGDDALPRMKKEDEHDMVHDPDMHDHGIQVHHDVHDPDVPNVDTGFMEV